MKKISKILAVVDPTTEDQPALRRAAWLAKKNGAELELLVCYYNEYLSGDRLFDSPSLEKARDEVIQSHEKYLEKMAEPLKQCDVHTSYTHVLVVENVFLLYITFLNCVCCFLQQTKQIDYFATTVCFYG